MKTQILIVEDNPELADNTKDLLEAEGYEVCDILDSDEKIEDTLFEKFPAAVLLDIHLKGNSNGIDIAHNIREKFNIPVIFFTSSTDKETLNKVKEVSPDGYIVKPFSKDTLITTLTLAISNYETKNADKVSELIVHDKIIKGSIFIRDKGYLKKIAIKDIDWIKADGSYTHISTGDNTVYTLRNVLKDVLQKLPSLLFCKVNKAFIVNLDKIDALNSKEILIKDQSIPVGRNYYQNILSRLNQVTR
ncbi:LytR/AlgR family response regulator transcription factor [Echinicola vietnamensis]|uniref:Response regulator of the LytR/AlgR family n=1 Tax=Echinicola vietnamensis (strain DSM 17526 / LMG 23754 / KMM 6221) TaxID=926556 RepID=L0G0L0_ECHVK|nr:response regulator [Echinicola vietnamensis]AGA78405.1 response regulator of the LytR/AlgR family [Echinicola vietnamensis DSM 17526]